eukprot:m.77684 g.77684  ORF g.77684 m.77684 type:complete len:80 (+) comp12636_c0_seq2:169-408(+)
MASKDSDQNLQEGNEAVESEEKIAPSEESVKDSQEGEETNNYPELPRADLLLEELEQNVRINLIFSNASIDTCSGQQSC